VWERGAFRMVIRISYLPNGNMTLPGGHPGLASR
jgi:hypothetical protein